jgi:hypothetical protein
MSIESDRPDENPPEIEIEIEPASGSDAPPPSEESSATPPVVGDLPDDLPPVPDDDLGDLPPVPDDDLADLPPIVDDDALPPIVPDETDPPVVEPVVAVSEPPEVELPPVDDPPPPTPPVHVGKLVLESVSSPGQNLSMSVSTKVGKRLCKGMGEDYKFLDDEQMEVIKTDSGWQVSPNASAKNETLLNTEAITTTQDLKEGDILAVGRVAKGVSKMEMRVSFS